MRKHKVLWGLMGVALAVIMAFAAACTTKPSGTGGGDDGTTPVKPVKEGDKCIDLEIVRQPTKTEYVSGESFKTAGLIFNAIYENGFTGDYGLTGGDLDGYAPKGPLTEAVTEITLKFEGFEKALPITVLPKTLLSMSISREPDVKSYEVGDTLDLTGLVVAAEYEEGTVENETNYVITDKNGKVYEQGTVLDGLSGNVELTVTIKSGDVVKTDTFTITVFSGITVQVEDVWLDNGETERPTDRSYTFITGNNYALEFNENNSNTHLKNDSTFTGDGYLGGIDANTINAGSNKFMTIEFHIYSTVEMKNADLVLIASSVVQSKEGGKMEDMKVKDVFEVYYGEDNNQIYIGDDVIIEGKVYPPAESGTTMWTNWVEVNLCKIDLQAGFNVVTIKCINTVKGADNWGRAPNIDKLEVRTSDDATVTGGDWVTGVTVTKQPTKTSYVYYDTFDPTGIEFSVNYRNGYTGDVALGADAKDFDWSPKGRLSQGENTITFTYKNYSWTQTVNAAFSGITLEAEAVRTDTTGDTDSYTVTDFTKGGKLNTSANGATCVEDIQIGTKIEFWIYSESAVTDAHIALRACSVDRYTDGTATYDTPFNEVFKLSLGDTQIEVGEDVVIAGRQKEGSESLWFIWTENLVATVDLQAGYNKITLECIGKHKDTNGGSMRVPNIDKMYIVF